MSLRATGRAGPSGPARSGLFVGLLLALSACAGGPGVTISPVTPTPTHMYRIGKFVWYDLVSEDVPAVKRFYAELFGWRYREIAGKDVVYTVIEHDGTPIGGIVPLRKDEGRVSSSRWLSLLSVEDVDSAVQQVKRAGGTVNMEPRDIPERGRLALVTDPQGAMLVLLRSSGGDPEDGALVTNRFMWTELWARDVGKAVELYRALVGYELESLAIPGNREYRILARDGRRRAGVIQLPWQEVTPNWLPYVKVDDPAAVAGRVEALGGRVLIAAQPEIRNGSVALLADPAGAAFAVQKWPADDERNGGTP